MDTVIALLPKRLEYGGSLAQRALVIVFVYVFKKNGSAGTGRVQSTLDTISENHLTHMEGHLKDMNGKIDGMVTNSAVQTEILRDIRDSLRK